MRLNTSIKDTLSTGGLDAQMDSGSITFVEVFSKAPAGLN